MTRTEQLLEALNGAGAEELGALDSQIKELRDKADSLAMIRKMIAVKVNGKTPHKKKAGGTNGEAARGGKMQDYRNRAVYCLSTAGPKKPMEIAAECDIPKGSITA